MKECPNPYCKARSHATDAIYCHLCGEKLTNTLSEGELRQIDDAIGQERRNLQNLRNSLNRYTVRAKDYEILLKKSKDYEDDLLILRQKAIEKLKRTGDMVAVLQLCICNSKQLENDIREAHKQKEEDVARLKALKILLIIAAIGGALFLCWFFWAQVKIILFIILAIIILIIIPK